MRNLPFALYRLTGPRMLGRIDEPDAQGIGKPASATASARLGTLGRAKTRVVPREMPGKFSDRFRIRCLVMIMGVASWEKG